MRNVTLFIAVSLDGYIADKKVLFSQSVRPPLGDTGRQLKRQISANLLPSAVGA